MTWSAWSSWSVQSAVWATPFVRSFSGGGWVCETLPGIGPVSLDSVQPMAPKGVHGDAETVYGTESNGNVLAWRRSDGARVWSSDRPSCRKLTSPLLLGRSVVIGDGEGWVHFLSRTDGAPLN